MTPPPRWLPPIDTRAVLVFGLTLALLLAPWPWVARVFGAAFGAYANGVARVVGRGDATFSLPPLGRAAPEDGGAWAVQLGAGPEPMLLDTRILAYTPVAVWLALAAASRLPSRRRLLVGAFALACVLLRTALAIALPVARAFGEPSTGWAFGPAAELVWFGLVTPPVMSYATPLVAWWIGFALTTPPVATSTFGPRGGAPRAKRQPDRAHSRRK